MTAASPICSSRSFGITIRVSQLSRSAAMPASAWLPRRLPSNENGRVTTPTVSAPSLRAMLATTGAPPVPVPPPSPAVTNTMSAPREQLLDLVLGVFGGLAPDLGVGAGAQPAGGARGRRRA